MAAAIVQARTTAGLTQDQRAQRLKTLRANIAHLERHTHVTVRTLQRIAAATWPPAGYRLPEMMKHGRGNFSPYPSDLTHDNEKDCIRSARVKTDRVLAGSSL